LRYTAGTRIFVVKVASRCNLACSYCYMYQHVDQSWRTQPPFMSRATVSLLANRLRQHARDIGASELAVVAHGGEPLLYPDLDYFFGTLRDNAGDVTLRFAVQTNGTLIDDRVIQTLAKYSVHVGVSLDGPREVNDVARRTHGGEGSFDSVIRGIGRLRHQEPGLLDSALQVINHRQEPASAVRFLEDLGFSRADFLLPDWNHDSISMSQLEPGTLGSWLIEAFDYWAARSSPVYIRTFLVIARLLLGDEEGTDNFGPEAVGTLIIETDGSYQIHDALKTAYQGAGHTGMTLASHPVHDVDKLPLARAFQLKISGVGRQCRECSLFPVCGGGSPVHRYKAGVGFSMPSAYCVDLQMLISHIARRLLELPAITGGVRDRLLSYAAQMPAVDVGKDARQVSLRMIHVV